jgi:hypothetical protein
MKFIKHTRLERDPLGRQHPGAALPTVLWDPQTDSPVFAFKRGASGRLELETNDPELIDLLTSAGYAREER